MDLPAFGLPAIATNTDFGLFIFHLSFDISFLSFRYKQIRKAGKRYQHCQIPYVTRKKLKYNLKFFNIPEQYYSDYHGRNSRYEYCACGNVFSDLIRSGRVATVALRDIFRQAGQSMIVRNAHLVNTGMPPQLKNAAANDFFFLPRRDSVRLVETVVELCKTRLPDKMGIPAEELQVLTPTRRGDAGTRSLNFALQAALNPPKPGKQERRFGELTFREGDRVMQTRNDYDVVWQKADGTAGTGIFNGDVGHIAKIDPSGELLEIVFDDRTATYTSDMLAELDMAYAMTVHKAQGSEYRGVIFVGAPCAPSLMVRGVLYTAITRARELLVIVGDDSAVNKMAENDRRSRRYSGLKWKMKKGGE